MIVGNPMRRSSAGIPSNDPLMKAVTFRCFQGDNLGSSTPGDSPDTFGFPSGTCTGGIRSNIYFPACVPDFITQFESIRGLQLGPLVDAGTGRTMTVRTILPTSRTPTAGSSVPHAQLATPLVSLSCSSRLSGIPVRSTTSPSGLQAASPSSSAWATRE